MIGPKGTAGVGPDGVLVGAGTAGVPGATMGPKGNPGTGAVGVGVSRTATTSGVGGTGVALGGEVSGAAVAVGGGGVGEGGESAGGCGVGVTNTATGERDSPHADRPDNSNTAIGKTRRR